MNINATLIGQSIAFFVFVWLVMRYIWPPMMAALEARKQSIADGLAAAQKNEQILKESESQVAQILLDAKSQAADILTEAARRGDQMREEAVVQAKQQAQQVTEAAHAEIAKERELARQGLRGELVELVLVGVNQIVEKEVNAKTHAKALDQLVSRL